MFQLFQLFWLSLGIFNISRNSIGWGLTFIVWGFVQLLAKLTSINLKSKNKGNFMFENDDDITDFLKKNKKQLPDSGDDEAPKGRRQKRGMFGGLANGSDLPPGVLEDIAKMISKEIKGKGNVEILPSGGGIAIKMEDVTYRSPGGGTSTGTGVSKTKFDGLVKGISYIGKMLSIAPSCKDVAGNQLATGDMLKLPKGKEKKVLEVGYGYAELSRTDDITKSDGIWFENELHEMNFIKK
jgi:hypothetical protein